MLSIAGFLVGVVAVIYVLAAGNFSSTAYTPGSVSHCTTAGCKPCGPYNDVTAATEELGSLAPFYTNRTASGICPKDGETIAVDPSVIPLGTTVCINELGTRVAQDTGGAIKGNIVDVFFEDTGKARQWGRRGITVTWPGPCNNQAVKAKPVEPRQTLTPRQETPLSRWINLLFPSDI